LPLAKRVSDCISSPAGIAENTWNEAKMHAIVKSNVVFITFKILS
jgi:hypothetical protein